MQQNFDNVVPELGVFLCREGAQVPTYGTKQSACFDLRAHLSGVKEVVGYDADNNKFEYEVFDDSIEIEPLARVMIPTGLIFDIPEGYSVRFHPRSGMSLKSGIVLGNLEAVIDSDYVQESMVILTNNSSESVLISHGDKICQGELVEHIPVIINVTLVAPSQKTDRVGGFGSTGKK